MFFPTIYPIFRRFLVPKALSFVSCISFDKSKVDVFDQFDDYSLMGVLDWLEFGDLANIATISQRSYDIIIKHYLSKLELNDAIVDIELSETNEFMMMHYLPSGKCSICEILCTGHHKVLSTLAAFCPIFKELRITAEYKHKFESDITRTLADHLNKYCSTVPQSMKIPLIKKPNSNVSFENVTNVHLMAPGYSKGIALDRNFPRMEYLRIDVHQKFSLTAYFPYLRAFELTETYCNTFDWVEFAAQNSQIRSLNIDACWPTDFLQQVNELFPYLESLHIRVKRELLYDPVRPSFAEMFDTLRRRQRELIPVRDNIAPVRFRNVKHFSIDISGFYGFVLAASQHFEFDPVHWAQDRLALIQFSQLESYKYITGFEMYLSEQLDLILNNRDLVSVDVSSLVVPFVYLQRLVDELPKLKEIVWMTDLAEPTNILKLMKETKLETIVVAAGQELRRAFNEMQSMPGQWKLEILDRYSSLPKLAFERSSVDSVNF